MDSTVSFEDRIQCVRYMCYIPYKDYVLHCIEALKVLSKKINMMYIIGIISLQTI
jgi:hypothetical protein